MENYTGPTTTADSNAEGRMKVDMCSHNKKKCLKCEIKKHDGKGGFGSPSGGYGTSSSSKLLRPQSTSKQHLSVKGSRSKKLSGIKSTISAIRSLNKQPKFSSSLFKKPAKMKNIFSKISKSKIKL